MAVIPMPIIIPAGQHSSGGDWFPLHGWWLAGYIAIGVVVAIIAAAWLIDEFSLGEPDGVDWAMGAVMGVLTGAIWPLPVGIGLVAAPVAGAVFALRRRRGESRCKRY